MNINREHADWCSCTQQAHFKMHAPLLSQVIVFSYFLKTDKS